jgi:uncharacterized membrane protein (UPF0136 family)
MRSRSQLIETHGTGLHEIGQRRIMQIHITNTLEMKHKLWLGGLAILGVAIVLLSTSRYGAGLNPDSVGYIGAARNILEGQGVTSYRGTHLVVQPPLYPALLALTSGIFGTDPLQVVTLVNAILFGLIVYFGGLLMFRSLSSTPMLALFASLAVLASIPLFTVSTMAWSEPLFILFTLLGILSAHTYIEKQNVLPLLLFSTAVALSAMTRYVGVAAIGWGFVVVVLFCRGSFRKKAAHAGLFTAIPLVSLGLWLLRNMLVAGEPFGPRASSSHSLMENLTLMFDHVTTWYLPDIIGDHRATLLIFGAVVGFIAGLNHGESWEHMRGRLRQNSALVLFIAVYSALLVISSTTTAYDSIGDRLLSPLYVPCTLILFILAESISAPYRKRYSGKAVNSVLAVVLSIWLLYPLNVTFFRAAYIAPLGKGYSGKVWRESETMRYIRQHHAGGASGAIYTNAAAAVYILTNIETATSPAETSYNSMEAPMDIAELRGVWPREGTAYLIWFDIVEQDNLFSVDDLRSVAKIMLIARFADGSVYRAVRH